MSPSHLSFSSYGTYSLLNLLCQGMWERIDHKRSSEFHLPMNEDNPPSDLYVKNFLKKVIVEVESSSIEVLDELYEHFSYYMTSVKDDFERGNSRVYKRVSFLFPNVSSCSRVEKVVIPLQCSVNMLEGDTGCSIWPSSLFLSEFVLSHPHIFSNKSCFEVGSGVGLVGISLAYVKASKVILTDGDLSTLANMKHNLELNQLKVQTEVSQIECRHLPWESASEEELQGFKPDIVLGADVIYDPLCLPDLLRVLTNLLSPRISNGCTKDKLNDADDEALLVLKTNSNDCKSRESDDHGSCNGNRFDPSEGKLNSSNEPSIGSQRDASKERQPVAYLATVVRNMETFDCFMTLANQAQLSVLDITETCRPLNLLPYMRSYDRASIRFFRINFS
ncbi:protein-lysine N-methyltransferase EEF2KMT-like isoform X2 [Papaver somniferum]|uniref:protein-lysine N-methyltransferase EEF2KMT-like isoform X2 n=1 Tax=Papaver somniferum TaxID=3469 RepID=UPI000E6F7CCE|nr:protein-lysine N-methyltransferase EEF2KMT-like isoform X2 [Papaver somniferum]